MAPCHVGAGALEHLSESHGRVLEAVLFSWAQLTQRPTGLKKGGAEAIGTLPQCLALTDRLGRGDPIAIRRGHQVRMPSLGLRLGSIELSGHWQLDAGIRPGLADHGTGQAVRRVGSAPIAACDQHCHIARNG